MGDGRLAGRVALITGASRGFGRAIALAFAREGARIAANYLSSHGEADGVVAEAGRLGVISLPSWPSVRSAAGASRGPWPPRWAATASR